MNSNKKDHGMQDPQKEKLLVKLKRFSYISLGVSIFFILGAIFSVDESTIGTLPVMIIIALLGISFFVLVKFKQDLAIMLVEKIKDALPKKVITSNNDEGIVDVSSLDETVAKYYTITLGLLNSIYTYHHEGATVEGIKRYIEFHTKDACDEDILSCALEHFESFTEPDNETCEGTSILMYRLTNKQSSLIILGHDTENKCPDIKPYTLSPYEAYKICYPEITESLKTDCISVLNVMDLKQAIQFEQGIKKVEEKHEPVIGKHAVRSCIYAIIKDLYLEGDNRMKSVLLDRMAYYLYKQMMTNAGSKYTVESRMNFAEEQAIAITVRALHFEQSSRSIDDYTDVSESFCAQLLTEVEHFKVKMAAMVAKNPFEYTIEKLSTRDAQRIIKNRSIYSEYTQYCHTNFLPDSYSDVYYFDSLCYEYWKSVIEQNQNVDSSDINAIFSIILTNLSPKEKEIEWLNAEETKRKIEERCRSCIFEDRCVIKGQETDCKNYIPK